VDVHGFCVTPLTINLAQFYLIINNIPLPLLGTIFVDLFFQYHRNTTLEISMLASGLRDKWKFRLRAPTVKTVNVLTVQYTWFANKRNIKGSQWNSKCRKILRAHNDTCNVNILFSPKIAYRLDELSVGTLTNYQFVTKLSNIMKSSQDSKEFFKVRDKRFVQCYIYFQRNISEAWQYHNVEIKWKWNVKSKVMPIIIWATGNISKSFRQYILLKGNKYNNNNNNNNNKKGKLKSQNKIT
jgi:hypothetical protein